MSAELRDASFGFPSKGLMVDAGQMAGRFKKSIGLERRTEKSFPCRESRP